MHTPDTRLFSRVRHHFPQTCHGLAPHHPSYEPAGASAPATPAPPPTHTRTHTAPPPQPACVLVVSVGYSAAKLAAPRDATMLGALVAVEGVRALAILGMARW